MKTKKISTLKKSKSVDKFEIQPFQIQAQVQQKQKQTKDEIELGQHADDGVEKTYSPKSKPNPKAEVANWIKPALLLCCVATSMIIIACLVAFFAIRRQHHHYHRHHH